MNKQKLADVALVLAGVLKRRHGMVEGGSGVRYDTDEQEKAGLEEALAICRRSLVVPTIDRILDVAAARMTAMQRLAAGGTP